jgi:hypothetical protein
LLFNYTTLMSLSFLFLDAIFFYPANTFIRTRTIQLFDFFDIVCYALYHNDTLTGFDVEGSNVQRESLQTRLTGLERKPFWQGIEHILRKTVEKRKEAEKFEQTNAHNQISIEGPSNV